DTGLSGKGVVVTGGAGGIGSAVVRAFATEGARVVVHYHSSAAAALRLAEEVGGVAIGADLRVEQQAEELLASAVAAVGRVDVCVANAGV
ncbi:MAG: SDR family NAD(P)-dependent oxidoreductase, partial [Gammaproteobacteria bacterium]|nr:SDR family NAD(P)-dependent oxidoreductase [Gammaproteobacteria bacterium]NIV54299.1 SDR family NAD(P)-dependent oxidoreductase [Actinomycetota bacterium]